MPADTAPAPWDGRPENPEVDGWHWVRALNLAVVPRYWRTEPMMYWEAVGFSTATPLPPDEARKAWIEYLGPALLPSEHHQRTLAASAAAWMAAREAFSREAHARADFYVTQGAASKVAAAMRVHGAIRALPPPADAMAALAEVVRVAVEKEREACALVVDSTPTTDQRAAREVMQRIRARSTERGA